MNVLELFAGAGGGILGSMLNGHRTVCAVEYDAYARSVLLARQNDGTFPPFPIWDDVCTFDGMPWRGIVDVVSGGFPCQDISVAGTGSGITGERSGLWSEMARIIGEVRPRYTFIENSPALLARGIDVVLADLHEMGFDAEWGIVSAADCGAPHKRERIWILAYTTNKGIYERRGFDGSGQNGQQLRRNVRDGLQSIGQKETTVLAYSDCQHEQWNEQGIIAQKGRTIKNKRPLGSSCDGVTWWSTEPDVGRVAHGVANRANRLKAIGNGQVPIVAATAFNILMERIK